MRINELKAEREQIKLAIEANARGELKLTSGEMIDLLMLDYTLMQSIIYRYELRDNVVEVDFKKAA